MSSQEQLAGIHGESVAHGVIHALRLEPGLDLRGALEAYVARHRLSAVVVVSAVGSLSLASLRLANASQGTEFPGPFEVLALSGTLGAGGTHLHVALADSTGRTLGGHLLPGSRVATTAEVVLLEAPGLCFRREHDPLTGYRELRVERSALPPTATGDCAGSVPGA